MNSKSSHFSVLSKIMIFALLGLIAFLPGAALAKIYKYKDDQGKTHFTDDASKIPLRYRKKGSLKKFREVQEPGSSSRGARKAPDLASAGDDKKYGILSSKEISLIRRTIKVFEVGVTLGEQFKNRVPDFPNGQAAAQAIQSALPLKERLVADLDGTDVPELKAALGFLKQSIAADQNDSAIGAGLKRRIANIFARLASEGKQQATMIKKLKQAIKVSEKKKEEAEKKKAEEAKKKAEEEMKQAEEAKKKAEEEANEQIEK